MINHTPAYSSSLSAWTPRKVVRSVFIPSLLSFSTVSTPRSAGHNYVSTTPPIPNSLFAACCFVGAHRVSRWPVHPRMVCYGNQVKAGMEIRRWTAAGNYPHFTHYG